MKKRFIAVVLLIVMCIPVFALHSFLSVGGGFSYVRDFEGKNNWFSPGVQIFQHSRFNNASFGMFADVFVSLPIAVKPDGETALKRGDFSKLFGISGIIGPCVDVVNKSRTLEHTIGLGFAVSQMYAEPSGGRITSNIFSLGVGAVEELKFYFNEKFFFSGTGRLAFHFRENQNIRNTVSEQVTRGWTSAKKLDVKISVGVGLTM